MRVAAGRDRRKRGDAAWAAAGRSLERTRPCDRKSHRRRKQGRTGSHPRFRLHQLNKNKTLASSAAGRRGTVRGQLVSRRMLLAFCFPLLPLCRRKCFFFSLPTAEVTDSAALGVGRGALLDLGAWPGGGREESKREDRVRAPRALKRKLSFTTEPRFSHLSNGGDDHLARRERGPASFRQERGSLWSTSKNREMLVASISMKKRCIYFSRLELPLRLFQIADCQCLEYSSARKHCRYDAEFIITVAQTE